MCDCKCKCNKVPSLTWHQPPGHKLMASDSDGRTAGWIEGDNKDGKPVTLRWYAPYSYERGVEGRRITTTDEFRSSEHAKAWLQRMYDSADEDFDEDDD